MVLFAPLVGAALVLSGFAAALPTNSESSSNYGSGDSSSNYGSSNSNYGSSNSGSNYGGNSGSNYGGNSGSNYGGNSGSNYGGNSGSNYGGNSGSNYGGNSGSNYGGNYGGDSGSNYGGNTNVDSTSTMMYMTSSTTEAMATSTPSYGSGSSYWGGSGYDDCVNQCIAQYGGGMGGSYQATATSGSYGSKGTGATHTVIVAPTKGVFRFMPFATNASVGDTIEFHWGADEHTVTKSSALTPCNKSSDAPVFASGEQNQSFVFTQVVNDTNPTFYYCGTPTHCEKGMFGVINPAMAAPGSPSSLGGMMASMASNDSDLSAYAAYSSNVTSNNAAAASWGSQFDMSAIPGWAQSLFATNVLYTRATLGMNAEILQADNSINLSSVAGTPLMLPSDISTALNAAAAGPSSASSTGAGPVNAAATGAESSAASRPSTNGAASVASSKLLVAGFVLAATFFAL